MTAPAKAYLGAPSKTERFVVLINNFKIAFDAQRAIIANSNFRRSHFRFSDFVLDFGLLSAFATLLFDQLVCAQLKKPTWLRTYWLPGFTRTGKSAFATTRSETPAFHDSAFLFSI
jgi:hypothetical protein